MWLGVAAFNAYTVNEDNAAYLKQKKIVDALLG
jgi:hypothetical protein